MQSENSVDVVILSLNRLDDTLAAIDSVIRQVGVQPSVWVIDQSSSADTVTQLRSALKGLPNVNLIELDKNLGVPGGRNFGMRLGSAEVIVCLDNDAIFESSDSLQKTLLIFEKNSRIGILGFKILNAYTRSIDRASWVYPRSLLNQADEYFITTRFCGAGHAVRRVNYEAVGGYDDSLFFYWEEVDLSNKIINLGQLLVYDPQVAILHKTSPDSRVEWRENRFFYLVRNILYLDWKYYQEPFRLFVLSGGYLIKGIYNGVFVQALRGIYHGFLMAFAYKEKKFKLTPAAQEYIYRNEISYRGDFWSRVKSEVFDRLDPSKS